MLNEVITSIEKYTKAALNRETNGYYNAGRKKNTEDYLIKVVECSEFLNDVRNYRVNPIFLKEALSPSDPLLSAQLRNIRPHLFTESFTPSDFDALSADILSRMVVANFASYEAHWPFVARRRRDVADFRSVKTYRVDGAEAPAEQVGIGVPHNMTSALTDTATTYAPEKFVAGFPSFWENFLNDDLDIMADLPQRLAQGQMSRLERKVTELYMTSTGPDTTTAMNAVTGTNPVFDVNSLGTAIQDLMSLTNSDGEPIQIATRFNLIYGPGLHKTVNNVMNALVVDTSEVGGKSNQRIRVKNWVVGNITPVLNPYFPIIATTNGQTSWVLMVEPQLSRPMAEVAFLTGFDTPQLFQKLSNTVPLGGGTPRQELGDFDTMGTEIKSIMVHGRTLLEKKAAVGSNGSGV